MTNSAELTCATLLKPESVESAAQLKRTPAVSEVFLARQMSIMNETEETSDVEQRPSAASTIIADSAEEAETCRFI